MNLQSPVLGRAEMNGGWEVVRMKRVTAAAKRSFMTPLQFFFISISGDLKESEPQTVLGFPSLTTLAESPKSQILMLKWGSKRMFCGFMSRWIMFRECRQFRPSSICRKRVLARVSWSGPSCSISVRSQGAYQKTRASLASWRLSLQQAPCLTTSWRRMMLGWLSYSRMAASFWKMEERRWGEQALFLVVNLMAKQWPSREASLTLSGGRVTCRRCLLREFRALSICRRSTLFDYTSAIPHLCSLRLNSNTTHPALIPFIFTLHLLFIIATGKRRVLFTLAEQSMSKVLEKPSVKLLMGAAGVYLAYLNLSVLNEKIYSYPYPSSKNQSKHIFHYADLVQMISAFCCLVYSLLSSAIRQEARNPIPFTEVIILGALYTLNVNTLNYSLYYIPYPVRVVGDKMGYLTAVIVAVFFTRIRHKALKLGPEKIERALMISAGAIGFAYFYEVKSSQADLYVESERWKGYLLIGVSVVTEALFGDSQAYAKATYKPSSNHMMFSVNLTTFFLNIAILVVSGTWAPSVEFCLSHQQIGGDILKVGALTVLGQISIYYVILNFRQHMFPLVATTRKILTILYSIYYFNHKTNLYMWISLVLVFGGILYQLVDELYYDLSGDQPIKLLKEQEVSNPENKDQ